MHSSRNDTSDKYEKDILNKDTKGDETGKIRYDVNGSSGKYCDHNTRSNNLVK